MAADHAQFFSPPGRVVSELVLASRSRARLEILRAAGLAVRAVAADVDEERIRDACRAGGEGAEAAALALARAKARKVADGAPALVIGADQILDCRGAWFGKPRDRADAAGQLRRLSGRTHRLVTGVSLMGREGEVWHHCDIATMSMVALDEDAIARYLDAAGDAALESVGAYQIEGPGIGLFDRVEGDYFAILGLPLVPLIGALRRRGLTIP